MQKFDVIVVGGGASGLMAAGRAAACGRKVLLVEKNAKLGEKLNLTGGGRCNITNAEFDNRTLLSFFGEASKFLFSPFSNFAVQETFDFFEGLGLPLVVEEHNRAFPHTHRASDVTRVLTDYIRQHGVEVRTGITVKRLQVQPRGLTGIETDQGEFRGDSVILATGGASYRATGSTGEGLGWLRDVGHTVHEATPDIVPLCVADEWVKALSGTTLDPVKISFSSRQGHPFSRVGKILFTHFGISGPMILNSANEVKQLLVHGDVSAQVDLFPSLEPHRVDAHVLDAFNENKNKIVRNVVKVLVPSGMSRALMAHLTPELLEKTVNSVTRDERLLIVKMLKGLPLTITGTMGYDWAVVCDGGVDLKEIDTRSMRSRLYPNLYIVGDLLHISRPSGGYSLQLCWTTGWVAGENA